MTEDRARLTAKLLEPILLLALAVPMAAIAFAWGPLRYPVGTIFLTVVIGWASVGQRALSQVEMNLAGIATGILCVVLTIAALHWFAAWNYREVRIRNERTDWPATWRWRWTLCLTAAVVMMFSAGLVGVGLFRTTSWFLQVPEYFQRDNRIM